VALLTHDFGPVKTWAEERKIANLKLQNQNILSDVAIQYISMPTSGVLRHNVYNQHRTSVVSFFPI
jgi:hypothetical protein